MSRFLAVLSGALLFGPALMRADEAQNLQEIRELKGLMEQQMKRIDELTVQVGRLHQSIEAQRASTTPGPAPKREVAGPPPFSGYTEMKPEPSKAEAPRPEVAKTETSKGESVPAAAPKAEPVNGVAHTVAKGETLTSIAKLYNISLAELQKANKDVNDRKLQIGQTIVVPISKAPESKTPEPIPTEKKENL